MKLITAFLIVSSSLLSVSHAGKRNPKDEFDLGGRPKMRLLAPADGVIHPDQVLENTKHKKGFKLFWARKVKGKRTEILGLNPKVGECRDGVAEVNAELRDTHFTVTVGQVVGGRVYQIQAVVKCDREQMLLFEEDSEGGHPVGIWQTVYAAKQKLKDTAGLSFWSKPIEFRYPGDGNYYSGGKVTLTQGNQWDVTAHEMGHAIYDQAKVGVFGGGSHKIDECYSEALALSEGWASFFGAFVFVDRNDADAKFEYLVPRRAPIRFERVPDDVCGKSTNEWRVTAFLWDLIDFNRDGEDSAEEFNKFWSDTLRGNAGSIKKLKGNLISKGWSAERMELIWKLNFPSE